MNKVSLLAVICLIAATKVLLLSPVGGELLISLQHISLVVNGLNPGVSVVRVV